MQKTSRESPFRPGVAIGEALVMDNEGFRIPRRFVARDAVDDELERLDKAIAAAGDEIARNRDAVSRELGEKYGGDLRGPPADAPGLAAPQRAGGDDPPAALLARVRRQPHAAPLRPGLPAAGKLATWPSGPTTSSTSRSGCCGTCWAAAAKGIVAPDLAGARAGPQSDAQRNGQSRPPLRPRLRHRDRRAGQPHGHRGRGAGNSRPSSAPGRS